MKETPMNNDVVIQRVAYFIPGQEFHLVVKPESVFQMTGDLLGFTPFGYLTVSEANNFANNLKLKDNQGLRVTVEVVDVSQKDNNE
jgi:hypothetical protein